MQDRFMRGFLAGIIAGLIGGFLALPLALINLEPEIDFYDFAAVFTTGHLPVTTFERAGGFFFDLIMSGLLGVVFAFLLLIIGSRYILFKGWFYSIAIWYMYYPLLLMILSDRVEGMDVVTSFTNALLAGLFGLIMAASYQWLTPAQEKTS